MFPSTCIICNTFPPQIKRIPEDTFAMYVYLFTAREATKRTPVYIEMYPDKMVALQKSKPLSSKQA